MELQFRILTILVLSITCLLPQIEPQSLVNLIPDIKSARALDAILQDYAYQAFVTPKTGISFNGIVPKNLTGIQISALRLRSGSLFSRGFPNYNEFKIPVGVTEQPYVKRLVLVYQNLGNWSVKYYPLNGYMYLAPILGLLAYDGSDLSAKNLSELKIQASEEPIAIDFGQVRPVPEGFTAMCVWVDLHGQVNFTNVVSGNRCLGYRQGHFSIVVNSTARFGPVSTSPEARPPKVLQPGHKKGGIGFRVWVIVICILGGCLSLVLLACLVLWIRGYKNRKKMHKMERAADGGEALHMTMVGGMKAPAAMVTRTQPTLETEYAP